jgi:hypothetical protein
LFSLAALAALVVAVESGTAGPADIQVPQGREATAQVAQATADSLPALSFEAEALSLTDEELEGESGESVTVRNETTRPVRLSGVASLSDLIASDAQAEEPVAARVVEVQRPSSVVAPGAGAELVLHAGPDLSRLKAGTYQGSLAAYAEGAGRVVRIPLSLSVRLPEHQIPEPAVDKHTIQAVRGFLWPANDQLRGAEIALASVVPANTRPDQLDLSRGKVLGVLTTDSGASAVVRYAGETKQLPNGLAAVELEIDGMEGPGTYSGQIDLVEDAEEETGALTLTVVSKDFVLWPVMVIIAGLWLALWVRRWRGAGRVVVQWRQRVAQLESEYRRAADKLKDTPSQGYDTRPSFKQHVQEQRERIERAARESYDQVDEQVARKIDQGFTLLSRAVEDLEALAVAVSELDSALRAVEALEPVDFGRVTPAGQAPPQPLGKTPAFVDHARRTLLSGSVLKVEDLRGSIKKMADTTELARTFPDWHAATGRLVEWLSELSDDRKEEEGIREARGELYSAWAGIYTQPTAAGLKERAREQELLKAFVLVTTQQGVGGAPAVRGTAISGGVPAPPEPLPAGRSTLGMRGRGARMRRRRGGGLVSRWVALALVLGVVLAAAIVLFLVSLPVGTLLAIGAAIAVAALTGWAWLSGFPLWRRVLAWLVPFVRDPLKRGDGWMTAVAWLVAIVTGLSALYFGKTFGGLSDYLLAGLWGLTTGTAVDALAEVARVRRQGAAPQPSPPAD